MEEALETELAEVEIESKHDPLMTAFVVMIVVLLLVFAILLLIANNRMPAGL